MTDTSDLIALNSIPSPPPLAFYMHVLCMPKYRLIPHSTTSQRHNHPFIISNKDDNIHLWRITKINLVEQITDGQNKILSNNFLLWNCH